MPEANPQFQEACKLRTLLLVEDHLSYREIVCTALGSYLPDFQIKTAGCIRTALEFIQNQKLDVLVADMTLPDGSALDLVNQAASFIEHGCRMIVISGHSKKEMMPALSHTNVRGYVSKEDGVRALAQMILEVTKAEGAHKLNQNSCPS